MGRLLLGISLSLMMVIVSGCEKDPFANEGENIKNAVAPDEEIPKVPPPESNTLFVDMQQVYSVVEGETLKIPVRYKIAHPDVTLSSIQVIGLEEKFPGSVYDEEKQEIRITPPYDFVPVDTAYIIQPLSVSFFNEYQGQVQEVKRTVVIHVIPENETAPVIERVRFEPANQVVTAGTEKKLIIEVFDTNKEFSPRLSMMNAFGTAVQGAQFIKIPDEGVYNPTDDVWEFTTKINVPRDFYLPSSTSSVKVDLFAYSITGIPSRSTSVSFRIESRTAESPKIVSEPKIIFYEKQENQYTFNAFDIRGSGTVTTRCENLPTGAACDCRRDGFPNNGIHFCTVSWEPETTGSHQVNFVAENKVGADVSQTTKRVTIDVRSAQ